MANTKNHAFTAVVKAMQIDAMELMDQVDIAAGDLSEGRRNSAVGALAPVDALLERLAALTAAIRAMHRTMPFE